MLDLPVGWELELEHKAVYRLIECLADGKEVLIIFKTEFRRPRVC
jgi:hypothetical protein